MSEVSQPHQSPGHIPALDGLRGIAILLVLLSHLTPMKQTYHGWRETIFNVADVGWVGVDLFFVLSAFLITNILINTQGSEHFFRNFYTRRALRIFPLYYLAIAIECLVLPHVFGVRAIDTRAALSQQWALWTYTTNLVPNIYFGGWFTLGHMWSLALEEQFYLFWAVAVAFTPSRYLGRLASVIAIALVITQIGMGVGRTTLSIGPFSLEAYTFCRFDGFLAGSLLAIGLRDATRAAALRRLFLPAFLLTGIVLWQAIRTNTLDFAIHPGDVGVKAWTQILAFPVIAVFFASLSGLAVTPEGRFLQRLLSTQSLRFLGKYSYGIYVVHGMLLPFFEVLMPHAMILNICGNPNLASLLYFGVASSVSIVAALLTFHLIESPFLRLKVYVGGSRSQAAIQPVVVFDRAARNDSGC